MNRKMEIHGIDLPGMAVAASASAMPLKPAYGASDSAEVNASTLLALDSALGLQHKSDVSASLLFAQLAATAACDKFTAPRSWTGKVLEVLSVVGWSVRGDKTCPPDRQPMPVDWPETTLVSFERLYGMQAPLVRRTIQSATALPGTSSAAELWNAGTYGGGRGLYLTGLAEQEGGGDPRLSLLLTSFTLSAGAPGILDWVPDAELVPEFAVLSLNLDVYSKVRQQILEKLGSRLTTDVKPVSLAG
ncbi:hypothetical protein [Leisingera sp.]|uniref:hypothetical protein n=1 Tax=Leisingera sp. TaxID=1879318 RepID=UPI002B271E0F|nr:hypothetical protein [Leisingera sp.]